MRANSRGLNWDSFHEHYAKASDPISFIAYSKFATGSKAKALWIIDETKAVDGETSSPLFTIERTSGVLLERWAPGTSELFLSLQEAKRRCQKIENMLCNRQEVHA